jgi:DNA ligase D-like protein (predicted ligase)
LLISLFSIINPEIILKEAKMLPENFQPMLASLAEPFDSNDYTYEIKWDGYRCLAFLDSHTRLLSRNQKDLTTVFPELQNLHKRIKQTGCLIDGEIIAMRNGKPSFSELQKRAQLRHKNILTLRETKIPVVYVAFDILFYNHTAIYEKPLTERRGLLADSYYQADELIIASFIETKGLAYFKAICELGLEGVVAKKSNSAYIPGKRGKSWLKFKRKIIHAFVVCGYLVNSTPNSRRTLRSLILGAYFQDQLNYFGMVGNGFTQQEMEFILQELVKLRTEECPFPSNRFNPKNTVWIKPLIVCDVEYLELTDEGSLRHPIFKRFRSDLRVEDCQYDG